VDSEDRARAASGSVRGRIDAFVVMEVMKETAAREALGQDVIHMEVGQPATPAPRLAREAAKRAIDGQRLGYTEALGLAALRERIALHYRETYGVAVPPERVLITTGSSAGFLVAFLALLDAGDRIGLPEPGYPCYRQIANVLGLEIAPVPCGPETGWLPDLDAIEALARGERPIKALVLASPANPTGTMLPPQTLAAVARRCDELGVWLISDEIYHGLAYGQPTQTALALSGQAIVINSFSKYYSMTGWRVGWLIAPEPLMQSMERLAQNFYISVPAVSQHAALAAFDATEELEGHKAVYEQNRQLLLEELPKAGFDRLAPADGAFYLYADVSKFTDDSESFVRRMLAETGVGTTPGIDFDPRRGKAFVRFCYAGASADMMRAVQRLYAWRK
jgi:aspartate/methionine/tyrosine aminotransferase